MVDSTIVVAMMEAIVEAVTAEAVMMMAAEPASHAKADFDFFALRMLLGLNPPLFGWKFSFSLLEDDPWQPSG